MLLDRLLARGRRLVPSSSVMRGVHIDIARKFSSSRRPPGRRVLGADVPSLKDFMKNTGQASAAQRGAEPELVANGGGLDWQACADAVRGLKFHMETYGCQMNTADSEIVTAVLMGAGLEPAGDEKNADVVLLNTCAIRDNAEKRVWDRLRNLRGQRTRSDAMPSGRVAIGLLGCMAERLKSQLLQPDGGHEPLVDFVAGPDAYRDLPRLLTRVAGGQSAMNVQLSLEETYADIAPVRPGSNGVTAFVSIMRGCNNMCSYCVVPFTRGRERSRPMASIVEEMQALGAQGYKEVTLLGQNVNSYWDRTAALGGAEGRGYEAFEGFDNMYKLRHGGGARFYDLLDSASRAVPGMRIRFTSPHPKDFPEDLLALIADRPNLCSALHMPAQSGSSAVLARMRRGYSREAYLGLVRRARAVIPNLTLSTDMIVGFCGETEEEHQESLSLMAAVQFEQAFTFAYSERSHTHAKHKMRDDVHDDVKLRRLQELIAVFRAGAAAASAAEVGREHVVLVEGDSKRSTPAAPQLAGRTDSNRKCVWDAAARVRCRQAGVAVALGKGDFVRVRVTEAGPSTLQVEPLERLPGPL